MAPLSSLPLVFGFRAQVEKTRKSLITDCAQRLWRVGLSPLFAFPFVFRLDTVGCGDWCGGVVSGVGGGAWGSVCVARLVPGLRLKPPYHYAFGEAHQGPQAAGCQCLYGIRKVLLAFRSAIPSRADLAAAGWARARASPLLPSGRYGFKAVSGRGSLGGTRLKRQGQVELGSHSLIASDGTGAQ